MPDIQPIGISVLLPDNDAPEPVRLPTNRPLAAPRAHVSSEWNEYFIRLSQVVSGIFFARELFLGSIISCTGAVILNGVSFLASVLLEQNRVLAGWQIYSDRCEQQIRTFQMNNTELKKRNYELQVEITALRTHIASLVALQETVGTHIGRLELLESAISEKEHSLSQTSREYTELYQKYESISNALQQVEQLLRRRVEELGEIASQLRGNR